MGMVWPDRVVSRWVCAALALQWSVRSRAAATLANGAIAPKQKERKAASDLDVSTFLGRCAVILAMVAADEPDYARVGCDDVEERFILY